MTNNDNINDLFRQLQGSFDTEETPLGHERRFMEKLKAAQDAKKSNRNLWRPLMIAASFVLVFGIGFMASYNQNQPDSNLASVSPEMEKTQSFFVTTIHQEVEKLKSLEDEDTKNLVIDALNRLDLLEKDYEKLEEDLINSGNDKRVINAMINNFQSRIDILERVITTIEEIKTLKANRNETIL